MTKHLRFNKIQMVERTGALMLVWFLDDDGNMYDWAPKWKDVEQVFLKQINVERFNKPESQWLNKFAVTAQQVVEGAQRIESGYKTSGNFKKYSNQQLIVGDNEVTPGFEVTVDFLDKWLGSDVELLVINDIAIRIRQYDVNFSGIEVLTREYPEPETKEF